MSQITWELELPPYLRQWTGNAARTSSDRQGRDLQRLFKAKTLSRVCGLNGLTGRINCDSEDLVHFAHGPDEADDRCCSLAIYNMGADLSKLRIST